MLPDPPPVTENGAPVPSHHQDPPDTSRPQKAAQGARGATHSPRSALCAPHARGPLLSANGFLLSRDHLMTCGSHRTLRSRCPQRAFPGATCATALRRLLPDAGRAVATEAVCGPRGLQDAPRSLQKTGAHPHTITDSVSPAARGTKRSKTTDGSGSKTLRRPRHLCDWGTLLV